MAVKIRLKRIGAKKKPFYRIVVADARYPRDGRFIEQIGTYDPMANPAKVKIDGTKVLHWMKNGAQPTDTVRALIKSSGALEIAREEELRKMHDAGEADIDSAVEETGEAPGVVYSVDASGADIVLADSAGAEAAIASFNSDTEAGAMSYATAAEPAAAPYETFSGLDEEAGDADAADAADVDDEDGETNKAKDDINQDINAASDDGDDVVRDNADEPAMDAAPDSEV